jgi:hypothetical protein
VSVCGLTLLVHEALTYQCMRQMWRRGRGWALSILRHLKYLKADVEARPRLMVAVAPVCECEALSYVANLRNAASSWVTVVSVCGLTLLVYEVLSYQCMRPSATCATLPLAGSQW